MALLVARLLAGVPNWCVEEWERGGEGRGACAREAREARIGDEK
jgi:hypothetical protein